MSLDPYAELGLAKDAPADTIRSAHRRAVKRAHPDAGGSAAAFERVQRSYLILSDPVRREKYDRTGDTADPDSVGRQEAEVRDALAHVIENAMSVPVDWNTQDLSQVVRDQISAMRQKFENDLLVNTKAQAKLASIRRRFKKKAKGDPISHALLEDAFEGKRQHLLQQATEIRKGLDLNERVGAVFDAFTYAYQAPPEMTSARYFEEAARAEQARWFRTMKI